MANLESMRAFAASNSFGLTGSLDHDAHVLPLAEQWRPLIRFHEDERFHPVGLDGLALLPRQVFRGLGPDAQASLEVETRVSGAGGTTVTRRFPPPALRTKDPQGAGSLVLNDLDDSLTPFARPEVGDGSVLTHGDSFRRSNSIFGSTQTLGGLAEPSPGDPRAPRHGVKIIAEFRMVNEALHYSLKVDAATDEMYPKRDDSLWNISGIIDLFFATSTKEPDRPDPFPISMMKDVMLRLLDGAATNDSALQDEAIRDIPNGWVLRTDVLETARNCAILEYGFVYAYNDYDQYEPWPANFHEGDDEGCCYIFDRRALERSILTDDANDIVQVPPLHVITSVHLERQQADRIKEFDVISLNEVFVARGSHATYLSEGHHDFLSPTEAFEEGLDVTPSWAWILSLGGAPILVGLLSMAAEHFMDASDETSRYGIAAGGGPGQVPADLLDSPLLFPVEVATTPLSAGKNIYDTADPPNQAEDQQLGLLSYAGRLGATDAGLGNVSGAFERKTARFFRKLIRSGRRIN